LETSCGLLAGSTCALVVGSNTRAMATMLSEEPTIPVGILHGLPPRNSRLEHVQLDVSPIECASLK
jgi:hypothetical protein